MAHRLRIAPDCEIPISEVDWSFGPSGGPGGQHANRAHTRAEARFDVAASPSLTERQRGRLLERLGPTVQASSDDSRSQHRNRKQALERLRDVLAEGLREQVPRRPTRPTAGSRRRRLDDKRRRSELKQSRQKPPRD